MTCLSHEGRKAKITYCHLRCAKLTLAVVITLMFAPDLSEQNWKFDETRAVFLSCRPCADNDNILRKQDSVPWPAGRGQPACLYRNWCINKTDILFALGQPSFEGAFNSGKIYYNNQIMIKEVAGKNKVSDRTLFIFTFDNSNILQEIEVRDQSTDLQIAKIDKSHPRPRVKTCLRTDFIKFKAPL